MAVSVIFVSYRFGPSRMDAFLTIAELMSPPCVEALESPSSISFNALAVDVETTVADAPVSNMNDNGREPLTRVSTTIKLPLDVNGTIWASFARANEVPKAHKMRKMSERIQLPAFPVIINDSAESCGLL